MALYGFVKCKRFVLDSLPASRALTVGALIFLAFGVLRMALTPHYRSVVEQEYARELTQVSK
jgi:hypothetical protein